MNDHECHHRDVLRNGGGLSGIQCVALEIDGKSRGEKIDL